MGGSSTENRIRFIYLIITGTYQKYVPFCLGTISLYDVLFVFCQPIVILIVKEIKRMITVAIVFVIILSALYVFDRIMKVLKCFISGTKFEQKRYERLLTFLSIAILITYLIV